jgi:hypothetical protein
MQKFVDRLDGNSLLGLGKMVNAIDQTIEGKKLEESQKEAILADGKNQSLWRRNKQRNEK